MDLLRLSHRIVHLDLKGAPLKVPYLDKFIPIIKQWGATGILLEWEDTFPYAGDLAQVGSLSNAGGDNLYSLAEVQHIIQCITYNGMEPIQLVQTMGHMEFVLKHKEFQSLQEVKRSPPVLCPSQPRSQAIVRDIVNQTLDIQPDAKYFHIGADEVWHTGICPQCKEKAANHKFKEASLYMDHIKNLILYIKQKKPDITVLMWDDMLRRVNSEILKDYNLGEHVIPVLWNYSPKESFFVPLDLVESYRNLFPQLWLGTAYKGANGSCQVLSPVLRYVSNHRAWVSHLHEQKDRVNYCGAILTGWSRYDHYATLCELLPSALPSLAACLKVLTVSEGLDIETDDVVKDYLPSDQWPGEEMAHCIHTFLVAKERCVSLLNSEQVNTWLNLWQMSRQYTAPGHVAGIAVSAEHSLTELQVIRANMIDYLQKITGERSTEEWIVTNIDPLMCKLTGLIKKARSRTVCEASIKPIVPDPDME